MKKLIYVFLLAFCCLNASAQNPTDIETSFGPIPGFNGAVNKIVEQPDGKLLVVGDFTQYKGTDCSKYLTRLLSDGSLDPTFNFVTVPSIYVYTIKLQSDGKILVGGNSTSDPTFPNFLRLNSDGSKDLSFNTESGFNNPSVVSEILIQTDGKILAVGNFETFNTVSHKNIARFNSDGTLDATFNTGGAFNNAITSAALQQDDKLLVTGNFSNYNGYTRNGIIRLNTDGTIDLTFSIGVGFLGMPKKVVVQPDGKIVVCGGFNKYKNLNENALIRLLTDGTKDVGFSVGTAFQTTSIVSINDIALDGSNNLIIAGSIPHYNGVEINSNCIRINPDGILDTSYVGDNKIAKTVLIQSDGKLVLGGVDYFRRKQNNGAADLSLDFGRGFNGTVNAVLCQPDGKFIVGGTFTLFNLQREPGLIRLNADGTKDTSFNLNLRGQTRKLLLQPDGKIIAYGYFGIGDSINLDYFQRFNTDGSLDNSFLPNSFSSQITAIALQTDGKILLGGANFFINPNVIGTGLIRLNSDGTVDNTFDVGTGFINTDLTSILVQPDNKILIIGGFTIFNQEQHQGIIRLLPNGGADPTFNTGEGFPGPPRAIILQPDGKILAGGSLLYYNVMPISGLARINSDGSLDPTFNPGPYFNFVSSLALQDDGKILLGGATSPFWLTPLKSLRRLNTDGSTDTTFDIGDGFYHPSDPSPDINSIHVQPGGQILVSGHFTSYKGVDSSQLVLLKGGNTLATRSFTTENVFLYPNPCSTILNIKLPSEVEIKSYQILDVSGKTLHFDINPGDNINVSTLASGIYFLKVSLSTGDYTLRFVKD